MLTTLRPMNLFSVNESDATFTADREAVSPCSGMDRCVGELAYAVAPATPPTIEFSMNGEDWDYLQPAPVGANAAVGITLYTWDIQIFSWAFVRLTATKPGAGGSARGSSQILPKIQN